MIPCSSPLRIKIGEYPFRHPLSPAAGPYFTKRGFHGPKTLPYALPLEPCRPAPDSCLAEVSTLLPPAKPDTLFMYVFNNPNYQ